MELVEKKIYKLAGDVSPEVFAQQTWKFALAQHLINCDGSVIIDRVEIKTDEDIAYVKEGVLDLEIPSYLWKWFEEVKEDEKGVDEGVDTTDDHEEYIDDSANDTETCKEESTLEITPQIVFDTGFIKKASSLILREPVSKSGIALQFALKHIFAGGSVYCINMESDLKMQESQIHDLLGLHERFRAVEKLEVLLAEEKERISQNLLPYMTMKP